MNMVNPHVINMKSDRNQLGINIPVSVYFTVLKREIGSIAFFLFPETNASDMLFGGGTVRIVCIGEDQQ